ncbi:uncharacterized protein [Symphalangus syndactylus]|uniref:uncharacterized protein n=1 Tax=Symphalangus syndactylus TaxID=9590 RepID=UPI002442B268|nr:uncharacterized protein LOC129472155 [Symphalangus syndactylus]
MGAALTARSRSQNESCLGPGDCCTPPPSRQRTHQIPQSSPSPPGSTSAGQDRRSLSGPWRLTAGGRQCSRVRPPRARAPRRSASRAQHHGQLPVPRAAAGRGRPGARTHPPRLQGPRGVGQARVKPPEAGGRGGPALARRGGEGARRPRWGPLRQAAASLRRRSGRARVGFVRIAPSLFLGVSASHSAAAVPPSGAVASPRPRAHGAPAAVPSSGSAQVWEPLPLGPESQPCPPQHSRKGSATRSLVTSPTQDSERACKKGQARLGLQGRVFPWRRDLTLLLKRTKEALALQCCVHSGCAAIIGSCVKEHTFLESLSMSIHIISLGACSPLKEEADACPNCPEPCWLSGSLMSLVKLSPCMTVFLRRRH